MDNNETEILLFSFPIKWLLQNKNKLFFKYLAVTSSIRKFVFDFHRFTQLGKDVTTAVFSPKNKMWVLVANH